MRRLLWLALLLAFIPRAHAGTCPIAAGTSSSIIVSTIGACTSGNTATFAAGTYSIANTVTVPCGVSIAGPIVPLSTYTGADGYKREGYSPAAILNWTGSAPGRMFNRGACSTTASINYVECNMNHPSSAGGQCVYNGSVTSNFSEFGNYFHGNQGVGNDGPQVTSLDYFDGNQSASADTNISITWNRFGSTGDCSTIMNVHTNYDGDCNGVSFHTPGSNITVNNNIFYYQENELKFYEGTGNGMYRCLTCTVEYNDFSNFHRIAFETQVNAPSSSGSPAVSMLIRYNSLHDPFNPSGITFGISAANGCDNTNPSPGGCVTNTDYNVIIDNVAAVTGNLADGIEQWGSTGSTANYNLIQGNWANSIIINKDGAFSDSNNLIQNSYGAAGANNPADCYPAFFGAYGWWGVSNAPANTPTGSGNTCSIVNGTTQTSVQPNISPASESFTGSQTVTLTNPGQNRDANTSIWYTIDGTNPVPGSGSAKIYSAPFSVTATTTVKAVGMWGAANQPYSYPTNYGYVPSAQVSATYTLSGQPQASTPTFSPAAGTYGSAQSVTISSSSSGAIICYSTSGTPQTNGAGGCNVGTLYTGAISVSSSQTLYAVAGGTGYTDSSVGSAAYTISSTPQAATPTFSPVGGSYSGTQTVTISATSGGVICYNTTGSPQTNGTTGCTTGTLYTGTVSVSASETLYAVSGGTGYTDSTVGTASYTISGTPALIGCYQGNATSQNTIAIGATVQQHAYCQYSTGTSPLDCSTTDANGNAVTTWGTTNGDITIGAVGSSNPGLITGAALGTVNSTVVLTGGGRCNPWTWTVQAATLTSVTASCTPMSYTAGGTGSCTATCNYATGSPTNCTTTDVNGNQATWASSNTGVGTITSPGGSFTAIAAGMTNITASVGSTSSPAQSITVFTPQVSNAVHKRMNWVR